MSATRRWASFKLSNVTDLLRSLKSPKIAANQCKKLAVAMNPKLIGDETPDLKLSKLYVASANSLATLDCIPSETTEIYATTLWICGTEGTT
jgi:hypothetical protein